MFYYFGTGFVNDGEIQVMKKIVLLGLVLMGVKIASAQIVVDAEMFKANPNMFMGKTITIKNPKYINKVTTPGSPTSGAVTAPVSGTPANATTPTPTGVIGAPSVPTAGVRTSSNSIYCNPLPNHTTTKWELGVNNPVCIQVQAKDLVMLPGQDRMIIKEVTFRVTPTMYLMTRCVIK